MYKYHQNNRYRYIYIDGVYIIYVYTVSIYIVTYIYISNIYMILYLLQVPNPEKARVPSKCLDRFTPHRESRAETSRLFSSQPR